MRTVPQKRERKSTLRSKQLNGRPGGRERTGEERQLAAVMEIANVINSRLDLDHILSTISRELSKVIDYDIGCVAIYEKDENCLYMRHVVRRNGKKSGENRYIPMEETNLIGWVAIHKKPIIRGCISGDERFNEIMTEENLMSDIVVPLITKESIIGTVNIGSYQANHFSEFDLELVTKFSQLTSIAIENSKLLKNVEDLGEKYRKLINSASDVIMLLNCSGEIVECNPATHELFEYDPEEVIGREVFLFTAPVRRDHAKKSFYRVLSGKTNHLVGLPYLKKGGQVVYVDIDTTLLRIKENPYVLAIAHNVTERKKMQEKITIQNRELMAINKRLKELDQLKSEFLGRISHELRTPLSIIMAYTGALIEDRQQMIDGDTRMEFLKVIETQSNKLLGHINDLLDLSKVEISETMLDVTPGSINELVRMSVKVVEAFAGQNGVEISVDSDNDIPIISFDPLRIRQVCLNLLNNAIKFSREHSTIHVVTRQTRKEIIVSVTDNGPGIDRKDIQTIFDNFTQIDGGADRLSDGMGIGLRLVKHYIGLHRGRVWIKSEKDRGSTFFFSLPKKKCPNLAEQYH